MLRRETSWLLPRVMPLKVGEVGGASYRTCRGPHGKGQQLLPVGALRGRVGAPTLLWLVVGVHEEIGWMNHRIYYRLGLHEPANDPFGQLGLRRISPQT